MIRAANYELDGEIEMAISVYEKLYELNSQSPVVANNLASLLTTHRSDNESLQRAFTLARRLRGTRDPIFQDTYGWIAYRLGNYEEALQYLEPAAAKLPDQPLLLYHLARPMSHWTGMRMPYVPSRTRPVLWKVLTTSRTSRRNCFPR